jgi:uncharacterized protein YehS (DUF1456 family)
MNPNDLLRSLRFLLDADDARMAEILALGGGDAGPDVMRAMLHDARHADFVPADERTLAQLLDGIVILCRGPAEPRPPSDGPVTNNVVIKKLRAAYTLKDPDMFSLLAAGGTAVAKPELNAWFRAPENSHFRACPDTHLKAFLTALAQRQRKKRAMGEA